MFVQVLHLGRVLGRLEVRHFLELVVRNRDGEAVAELADRRRVELLQLVRRVLALADLAHAVALDGLGQDDGRAAFDLHRRGVRRVDLVRIVAAAVQPPDVVVGHARHHLEQLRILAEEVLAHEGAVVGLEVLVLAVDGVLHHAQQPPVVVPREQRIPVRAPDHLDHLPAVAAEAAFELLDDLAVAAHRSVEALQVAVDDEDEVVELLARRHPDGAERLRFVHLAVAAEHPHLAAFGVRDAARVQVLQVARHVDGLDRPEAHRHGRELPEVRHQLRVRVRRDALAVDVAPEVVQLILGEAAFHEGARVHARRAVSLEVDQVAAEVRGRRAPEVVEPDLHQRVDRRVAGDVAAEVALAAVGPHDHRHRVPADVRADALLDRGIPRKRLFLVRRDRVQVGRVGRIRDVRALAARLVDQRFEQEVRALGTFALEHRFEGVEPLSGFGRVVVVRRDVGNGGHCCLLVWCRADAGPARSATLVPGADVKNGR